jgi:hypothetical protein
MDKLQKSINEVMGISDQIYEEFGPLNTKNIEMLSLKNSELREENNIQKFINKLLGISDAIYAKYGPK